MSAKILLVEDDPTQRKFYAGVLGGEGHEVFPVPSAELALDWLAHELPDLVLSDIELGRGMDGIALCMALRADPRLAGLPVILISGVRLGSEDELESLDHGADDYIMKPAPVKIFTARVRAVLRRHAAAGNLDPVLRAGGLALDERSRTVAVEGKSVRLTRREFDLLAALLVHRGHVLSAEWLLNEVWGVDAAARINTETVKVHISTLRAKLGGAVGDRIATLRGVGYKFDL